MTKQEFLAFSLPYELKTITRVTNDELPIYSIIGLLYGSINFCRVKQEGDQDYLLPINIIMPILHPLSDLDSYNINSPMNLTITLALCFPYSLQRIIENRIATNTLSMVDALELIRHHFDIADLISKGEAIDVNTLEINPYK